MGCTEASAVLQHMYNVLKQVANPNTEPPPNETLGVHDPQWIKYSLYKAVDAIVGTRQCLFVKFFQQSLAIHFGNIKEPSKLQKAQISDPDQYSPFREHTPSCKRMKSVDDPFNKNTIPTIPGIFSAIIWQAITYRTPFAISEKAVFKHIDEWEMLTAQFNDQSYYCNTSAYGPLDPGWRECKNLLGFSYPATLD